MHILALLLLLFSADPSAKNPCPFWNTCTVSTNYAYDMVGETDTRPGEWGTAGSADWMMVWHDVPPGMRVKILHIAGDGIAAPSHGDMPPGTRAYALFGLLTTDAVASPLADFSSNGCMLFTNTPVSNAGERVPINQDVYNGLLAKDNTLHLRAALFLNDSGISIHEELTLVITFAYVSEESLRQEAVVTATVLVH